MTHYPRFETLAETLKQRHQLPTTTLAPESAFLSTEAGEVQTMSVGRVMQRANERDLLERTDLSGPTR